MLRFDPTSPLHRVIASILLGPQPAQEGPIGRPAPTFLPPAQIGPVAQRPAPTFLPPAGIGYPPPSGFVPGHIYPGPAQQGPVAQGPIPTGIYPGPAQQGPVPTQRTAPGGLGPQPAQQVHPFLHFLQGFR